jgi:diguanylate cyclase (GGDEF)-like protein/putative nucleotidyltransferase with HDIG domain
MTAWTRHDGDQTTAERLAEFADALVGEINPERVGRLALDAIVALTGADGGEVFTTDARGESARVAIVGAPADGSIAASSELRVGGTAIGRITRWGGGTDDADAATRVVCAQLAQALGHCALEARLEIQRTRERRFGEAVRAMRSQTSTELAVTALVQQSCHIVGGAAAALIVGLPRTPGSAVCEGLDPAHERDLVSIVAGDLHVAVAEGRPWTGPVPVTSALRIEGLVGLALAPVGEGDDAIGILAVLTNDPAGVSIDDLEALAGLAGHAAAALGAAALKERVEDLGTVDPVTRFFNERYFRTRLEQEAHRALRQRETLSLLIIALDGLGRVRETEGAAAADRAMEALADHLVPRLRATDVGCRISPDEVAVVLPTSTGLDAFRVGERVRASFGTAAMLEHGVSLSMGVASFPDQTTGAGQLADSARQALVYARRHGGERTFLFDRDVASVLDDEDRRTRVAEETLITTISALAGAVDDRHASTRDHSRNVARVAALLAEELGLDGARVEDVRLAGLLHDVGKIGVSDELIVRAGPLSAEEWVEMRQHPEIGHRMLSGTRLRDVREWVLHHHERLDGAGYPTGLVGEQIPLESKLIAIANALDTMTHDRPYRLALSFEDAMSEIAAGAGTQFDPVVVDALNRLIERGVTGIRPE